jgi:alpha-tubulin suppressor-like RCC1 family protein
MVPPTAGERGAAWRRAQWQAEQHPVPVAGGLTASVMARLTPTGGVTTAGAAYCWGEGYYGELGVGSTEVTNTPTAVVGGLTFAAVSARGEKLSCGVTTTVPAYCWGPNTHGELGIGTSTGPEQCLKGFSTTAARSLQRSLAGSDSNRWTPEVRPRAA